MGKSTWPRGPGFPRACECMCRVLVSSLGPWRILTVLTLQAEQEHADLAVRIGMLEACCCRRTQLQ